MSTWIEQVTFYVSFISRDTCWHLVAETKKLNIFPLLYVTLRSPQLLHGGGKTKLSVVLWSIKQSLHCTAFTNNDKVGQIYEKIITHPQIRFACQSELSARASSIFCSMLYKRKNLSVLRVFELWMSSFRKFRSWYFQQFCVLRYSVLDANVA